MRGRHRYLICYDISDAKRLRRVAKVCESYGTRIQFSVFEASLSQVMLASLRSALDSVIHHDDDQILFIDMGKDDVSTPFTVEYIGAAYVGRNRITII